ncbi:hypothetical protein [Mesorhizobium sp. M7A.F.Ca.MR.176.00.0.0]|nr:hypothetical protein [Mesorhizobium sp. M7A.F.Ca.MR.176.00.0.0]
MPRYATIITDDDGQEIASLASSRARHRSHAWGVSSRSRPS